MQKKPDRKNSSIFSGGLGITIFTEGIMIGLIATLSYMIGNNIFGSRELGKTMTFCTLSMSQLFHAFAVQSEHSIFSAKRKTSKFMILSFFICMLMQVSVVAVGPLREIFRTCEMNLSQWAVVIFMSSLPLVVSEIEKTFAGLKKKA